jgi:hypothetical protein
MFSAEFDTLCLSTETRVGMAGPGSRAAGEFVQFLEKLPALTPAPSQVTHYKQVLSTAKSALKQVQLGNLGAADTIFVKRRPAMSKLNAPDCVDVTLDPYSEGPQHQTAYPRPAPLGPLTCTEELAPLVRVISEPYTPQLALARSPTCSATTPAGYSHPPAFIVDLNTACKSLPVFPTRGPVPGGQRGFVAQFTALQKQFLIKLQELTPPPSLAGTYSKLVANVQTSVRDLKSRHFPRGGFTALDSSISVRAARLGTPACLFYPW